MIYGDSIFELKYLHLRAALSKRHHKAAAEEVFSTSRLDLGQAQIKYFFLCNVDFPLTALRIHHKAIFRLFMYCEKHLLMISS